MKLSHLRQIAEFIKKYKKISSIYRVSDTILKIVFDKKHSLYFDMQRGNSSIFKCKSFSRSKIYSAPFDIMIANKFNHSNIESVDLLKGDKVLRFKIMVPSSYKKEITYLQVEFTGKYTNIIVLDKSNIVLEAMRHIDISLSFREVRVGQVLLDIPTPSFVAKEYPLENIEDFLYGVYEKEQSQKLYFLKKQKLVYLDKKFRNLEKKYLKLSDEDELREEIKRFNNYGNLILSNIHNIKPYSREISLIDFDNNTVIIKVDKDYANVSDISSAFFIKSKKSKQKLKNLHIEKTSLKSKIKHFELFINIIENARDISKILLLFPSKQKQKKSFVDNSVKIFWIEGYKVSLGTNEKGNIAILKNARSKDIWIHMKDIPSAHVIIKTDKQNLPLSVIQNAARLCVDFTTKTKDRYLVDYTQRREVTIQSGAKVLYNNYKTIEIDTKNPID